MHDGDDALLLVGSVIHQRDLRSVKVEVEHRSHDDDHSGLLRVQTIQGQSGLPDHDVVHVRLASWDIPEGRETGKLAAQ